MNNALHNARVQLLATFTNNLAVAIIVAGIVAGVIAPAATRQLTSTANIVIMLFWALAGYGFQRIAALVLMGIIE